ncbi:cd129f82-9bba-4a71-acdc-d57eeb06dec4 [Thermothielavioides terrestris]|uniref:Cd129f82-9bba-4a71-acdc-d57eeb06dec4 n=1 Tax=Thermothielavioides terrestris TaxID=2587410 RepID=A0A3S4D706_9PEZI|nr:cd129f82-9bba-4a71-acdc-d57eeb06dec4 [Thermothielavioides terrestris]
MFAIGAQFSDLRPKDKISATETFFNRGKAFVGLDFIDMHNVGVVQSLLLMALMLQGTPFPSRCWNAMCFYVEYIRLCRILGEILSNVYQPSAGGSPNPSPSSWDPHKTHGMDAILDLDAKLSRYETALAPIMSWKSPCDLSGLTEDRKLVIMTQRTVLRGSFLYLRLMLHRPILTSLCAKTGSNPDTEANPPETPIAFSAGQELFTSFAAGCAKICLGAAMDLIELVHSTYLSNTTGGWWWDGLYAFTAGLAVIMGYLSPQLLASLDKQRLERCWTMCQEILAHFASFSISAQRSLRLLQKVHADAMSRSGACLHAEEMSLDLASMFQWQFPAGGIPDMLGTGLLFNWNQSLDVKAGGLGMDMFQ